jgi:hypothetical protein
VAFRTPWLKWNISLLHLPKTADSDATFTKKTASYHDRAVLVDTPISCVESRTFPWPSYHWLQWCTDLFSAKRCAKFTSFLTVITRTSRVFKPFRNPEDSGCPYCNMNRKLLMILVLYINSRNTRRIYDFDKNHLLICLKRRHLISQFSVAIDNR